MFSTTDCDLRYAAHTDRVARIDGAGWQLATAVPAWPRLAWVGALTVRFGRLASPTRAAGRVAASHAGRGIA
jgi:hypothetical protein